MRVESLLGELDMFQECDIKDLILLQYFSDYRTTTGYERAMEMDEEEDDSQHIPSDIDSQVRL